jgi:hypothetical protein
MVFFIVTAVKTSNQTSHNLWKLNAHFYYSEVVAGNLVAHGLQAFIIVMVNNVGRVP